jgi:hypothetical protein
VGIVVGDLVTIPFDGNLVNKPLDGLTLCPDGLEEGREDGWYEDGAADLCVGDLVGINDDNFNGDFENCLIGDPVGFNDGNFNGDFENCSFGDPVGFNDGNFDGDFGNCSFGDLVGFNDGNFDGDFENCLIGFLLEHFLLVGCGVGLFSVPHFSIFKLC